MHSFALYVHYIDSIVVAFLIALGSDLEQRENKSKPLNSRARHRMHRLQCLRFWLLYSVNSVHSYLMGQVLHLLSLELEHKIEQAQDLDALMKGKRLL